MTQFYWFSSYLKSVVPPVLGRFQVVQFCRKGVCRQCLFPSATRKKMWFYTRWREHITFHRLILVQLVLQILKFQTFFFFCFLCPATRKWRGIMLYPPKFWVSVRPSVCPSVRPSVRPSAPTTILVSATPPTVLGQSFWNFTGVLRMVWRYAYCFFRILKLFFITFFAFLT